MPAPSIADYLQTQGLRLPEDDIRMAYLAAETVMNMGEAAIDRQVLWYANSEAKLAEHIEATPDNEHLLKQIFMALDSVCTRNNGFLSAIIYGLMPSENCPLLIRLAQQGRPLEQMLMPDEVSAQHHLPCRTAQTGWLNLADDVSHWLSLGELAGERNRNSQSQISLPICTESGAVLGVLHVEHADKQAFDESAQAQWVALALALSRPLQDLLNPSQEEAEDE